MLGMYDMPALQPANDRLWTLIRSHLGYGPDHLTREADVWEVWLNPDLIFAQTCGMPYRTRLHGSVQLVGTPDYELAGCPPGHYRSILVARQDDERSLDQLVGGTFAFNEPMSQSGWAAPLIHLAQRDLIPSTILQTGGHAQSARAVADGHADFTALDALTWELLKQHTGLGSALREVDATEPTPALPYITANGQAASETTRAVRAAIHALSVEDRRLLHLHDLIDISAEEYLCVPNPNQDMVDQLNP